jgi:hypothetical protein
VISTRLSLNKEALRPASVRHKIRDFLGVALFTRFNKHDDVNDMKRAIISSARLTDVAWENGLARRI